MRRVASSLILAVVAALFLFAGIACAAPTVCSVANGCIGTGTAPTYGQILVGGKSGEYEYVASSTLGSAAAVTSVFGRTGAITAQTGDYTTSQVPEGSNLYYTLTRWATALAGTTTDALREGSSNLYFTNARAVSALTGQNISIFNNNAGYLTSLAGAASSTLLSDNNTFKGNNALSTTTTAVLNGMITVTGFPYPKTGAGIIEAANIFCEAPPGTVSGIFVQAGSCPRCPSRCGV